MFKYIVPVLSDDADAFLPWAFVCMTLIIIFLVQIKILDYIESKHEAVMLGINPRGAEMNIRLENALWNDRVRHFLRDRRAPTDSITAENHADDI